MEEREWQEENEIYDCLHGVYDLVCWFCGLTHSLSQSHMHAHTHTHTYDFKGFLWTDILILWIEQVAQAVGKAPSVQILWNTLGTLISVLVIFYEQKLNLVLKMGMVLE